MIANRQNRQNEPAPDFCQFWQPPSTPLRKYRAMSLDLDRLEKVRRRGCKIVARCPACAEIGADHTGEHLYIADEGRGRYACVVNPGSGGADHRKRIWALAGSSAPAAYNPPAPRPPVQATAARLPHLRRLHAGELTTIAQLRGWHSTIGLELLSWRGLLWFGKVYDDGCDWPAWIITDPSRRNAQARRLDGGVWHGIGGAKAKSLPGSIGAWPIGVREIGDRPFVFLTEGQPDFCAAPLVVWFEDLPVDHVAPVCICGAGNKIQDDALPLFLGKHVCIAVHADQEGREAGARWARQLNDAGAALVTGIHFENVAMRNGQPVEDLADYATLLVPGSQPDIRIIPVTPAGLTARTARTPGIGLGQPVSNS